MLPRLDSAAQLVDAVPATQLPGLEAGGARWALLADVLGPIPGDINHAYSPPAWSAGTFRLVTSLLCRARRAACNAGPEAHPRLQGCG